MDEVTTGLRQEYSRLLYNIPVQDSLSIADYILSMKTEVNPSDHYRQGVINCYAEFQNIMTTRSCLKTCQEMIS
jgi:hypothetical protein